MVALDGSDIVWRPYVPRVWLRVSGQPWLILPTFDEAENIELIVGAALEVLRAAAPEGFHILVVDDDSPDGTGRIADRLAREHDEVEVLHRTVREGLGPAYLAGFQHALDQRCRLRVRDGLRLLPRPRRPRAPAGGRARRGAPTSRWARATCPAARSATGASCAGSSAAAARGTRRSILGLPVRDLTGGFKCFRAEVLRAIDLPSVRAHGYAFQVELTNRTIRHGFRVVEVPITFRDRLRGKSKMSTKIALEAMVLVPRLRRRDR